MCFNIITAIYDAKAALIISKTIKGSAPTNNAETKVVFVIIERYALPNK